MLTKTKIVLSVLLVAGFASAAVASDSSEVQSRQAYPFLERAMRPVNTSAYAYAPAKRTVKPFTAAERAQFDRASAAALTR
jgi:hypothetical protein